ncbi:MAG TPA: hypothetical protein VE089_05135 [Nitrososphaeraceae archaeon]|jgi:hypothetical protein|nr:hypothetical protein [Nitrososphaeraceae archaeon]
MINITTTELNKSQLTKEDLVYLRVAVTQFLGDKEYLECMPENYKKILELDKKLKLMINELESEKK